MVNPSSSSRKTLPRAHAFAGVLLVSLALSFHMQFGGFTFNVASEKKDDSSRQAYATPNATRITGSPPDDNVGPFVTPNNTVTTEVLIQDTMNTSNALVSTRTTDNTLNKRPGQINFLHIPKTGGTTIEHLSLKHNHVCGLWGSRMVGNSTFRKEHGGWGPFYWQPVPNTLPKCTCAEWHMPPAMLPESLRQQLYPAQKTFCTLRDPLERFISYVYYHFAFPFAKGGGVGAPERYYRGPCYNNTAAHFNELVEWALKQAASNPCVSMCHALPQREFISGQEDYVKKNKVAIDNNASNIMKQCDEILLLNKHFSAQFDALMERMECPIRYGDMVTVNSNGGTMCKNETDLYLAESIHLKGTPMTIFTVQDLSPVVLDLAKELYRHDIVLYEELQAEQARRLPFLDALNATNL